MQTAVEYRLLIKRYLLGDLTEPERQLLEDKVMCEGGLFRELLVVEDELIDDYVCDKLSENERNFFEACFLHHNEERRQKLRFAWALKTYVSRDPGPQSAPAWVEPRQKQHYRRFLSLLFPRPQVALGAGLAVAFMTIVLGVAYSVVTVSGLQNEVAQIQADQRANDDTLTPETKELMPASPGTNRESFHPSMLLMPGGMRSSGQTTKVNILPETLLVKFRLDMAMAEYENYRAVLTNEGMEILRQDLLSAQDLGDRIIISLELPAGVLSYGDYQIRIYGKSGSDEHEYVDTYNFRAIVG